MITTFSTKVGKCNNSKIEDIQTSKLNLNNNEHQIASIHKDNILCQDIFKMDNFLDEEIKFLAKPVSFLDDSIQSIK